MSEASETELAPRQPFHAAHTLRGLLVAAALLVLIGALVLAAMATSIQPPSLGNGLLAFATLLMGIFLSGVLAAAAWIVGAVGEMQHQTTGAGEGDDVRPALERLEQSLRMLNSIQTKTDPRPIVESANAGINIIGAARHPGAVEELRDLMLMSEEQRKQFADRHWAQRKRTHLDAIEREVLVGDWSAVFSRLDELSIVMPGDPQLQELQERVESEQTARLDEDVRSARGRLRPLMNSAMWAQAETLADSLQTRYPGKEEADRVVEDVRREREAWERENSDRLFRDIAAANGRRQWRGAILALEEFVRRYPLDPRAEALRLDLPTLQENAAAHDRKQAEEHFKDLLKHQRYDEAISVAREVLQKYPHSPTATELNKLLPRVQEMATQEAARVAAQPPAAPVAATA